MGDSEKVPSIRALLVSAAVLLILTWVQSESQVFRVWFSAWLAGIVMVTLYLWDKRKTGYLLVVQLVGASSIGLALNQRPDWVYPPPTSTASAAPIAIRAATADDISVRFVADQINIPNLDAHLLVRNNGPHAVELKDFSYEAVGAMKGGPLDSDPRRIPAGEQLKIDIVEENHLIDNPRFEFRYNFKFDDGTVGQGYQVFVIPAKVEMGEEIPASSCCSDGKMLDLGRERAKQAEKLMLLPEGGFDKVFPEVDDNGDPTIFQLGRPPGKYFVFDFRQKLAMLISGEKGQQKILVSGLRESSDNRHLVRVTWNDKKGIFRMYVDQREARRRDDLAQ